MTHFITATVKIKEDYRCLVQSLIRAGYNNLSDTVRSGNQKLDGNNSSSKIQTLI